MKKRICFCIIIFLFMTVCFYACETTTYTVDFVVDGVIYHTAYVKSGGNLDFPDAPTLEGCQFDNWYLEEKDYKTAFNQSYIEENKIKSNFTVYGRWIVFESIGLTYALKSDGTFEVTGYEGEALDVVIPDTHNGKKVTAIASSAFSGLSKLRNITIPATVSEISPSAFNKVIAKIEFSLGSELSGIGSYVFDNYKGSSIVIPENVLSIEPYAFFNATNLGSVQLPSTLTSIQPYAFYNCTNLTDIILPESLTRIGDYAFSGCASIPFLQIPEKVTSIGQYAFSNVVGTIMFSPTAKITTLDSYAFADYKGSTLKIPASVTEIYDNVFQNCSELSLFEVAPDNAFFKADDGVLYNKAGTTLLQYPVNKQGDTFIIPSTVTTIGASAFSYALAKVEFAPSTQIISIQNYAFNNYRGTEIKLPESVKSLGKGSFANCINLVNFTIPSGVVTIGESAFSNTSGNISFGENSQILSINSFAFENFKGGQVIIPSSVTSIDAYAFSGCQNITKMVIPDKVESINSYAFFNCINLKSISLPEVLKSINSYAFYNCASLTIITIPKNVTLLGTNLFSNVTAEVVFAQGSILENVGGGAFAYYKGEELTLPGGVTEISSSAFYNCTDLANINLPANLQKIGDRAFYNCTSLTDVMLPASVNSIGSFAFSFMTGSISFDELTNIQLIGNSAFYNYRGVEIIIPESVTALGASSFAMCTTLTGIAIPRSVISIGDKAFYHVTAPITFEQDTLITVIGQGAFSYYMGNSLTLPASVQDIGERAFYNCPNLTSIEVESENPNFISDLGVLYNKNMTSLIQYPIKKAGVEYTLPGTVTNIYSYAFSFSALESITISKNVKGIGSYAFSEVSGNIIFPYNSTIMTIASQAFSDYKGEQVTLPSSVNNIGQGAFSLCKNLVSIAVEESNTDYTAIDGVLYDKNVTKLIQYPINKDLQVLQIPETVTQIMPAALNGNTYITKIIIPASVADIGLNALYNCNNIVEIDVNSENIVYKSIEGVLYNKDGSNLIHYPAAKLDNSFTVPDSVTKIFGYAFKSCNNLTRVIFTENSLITTFDQYAFRGCNNLTQVVIPEQTMLTTIGQFAFYGCSNLVNIDIPDSVTSIGTWAFEGCNSLQYELYGNNLKYLGNWLIDIADKTVSSVNLKSTTLGIGSYAFKYMSNITSITLPSSLVSIEYAAFEYASSLVSVVIPESVNAILSSSFYGCTSLTTITVDGEMPTLGSNVFTNTKLSKIYVDANLVDAYKAASGWSYYAAKIFPKE